MKDEIVLEGERHYFSHNGKLRNPYPIGSDEYNKFERGWVQALKKSEAGLLSSSSRPSESEFPIRSLSNEPQKKTELEKQAAMYKARKG